MYPKHGKKNILRRVEGQVENKGVGPNGPYLTVIELNGSTRTFSTKKSSICELAIAIYKVGNMKDIIIDFAGWIRLSPETARFQYIGLDDSLDEIINGKKWQTLNEDEQSDYIIEDIITAQRDCDDGSYEMIEISLE